MTPPPRTTSGSLDDEPRRYTADAITGVITATGLVGAVVHSTVRDGWVITAPVFYALPISVVAILWSSVAFLGWRRKKRVQCAVHVALATAALVGLVRSQWCWVSPVEATGTPIRVVTWNVLHGRLGDQELLAGVVDLEPDLVALQECGELADRPELWSRSLPGYQVVPFGREMLLLVRGTVARPRLVKLGPGSRVALCEVRLNGQRFDLAVVDFASGPFRSRGPIFDKLLEELDDLGSRRPQVVLGDFNTPRRSRCFDGFRPRLRNAFEEGGKGLGFTWPSLLPIHDLDQIWVTSDWRVVSCETPWTWRSDHRPVLATLE